MNISIQEILENIINSMEENLKSLSNGGDISSFIIDTKKSLDQTGIDIVKNGLEFMDDLVKDSKNKRKDYYIEKRNQEKTLITIFGEVNYKRTYYKNKHDNSYSYLSDEMVGIEAFDRMDLSYKAELLNKSTELSYEKSSKEASGNIEVSKQTVMNVIRELNNIESQDVDIKFKNKEIKTIFIEADEDHVSIQDGSNKDIKLIYVHEGKKLVSKIDMN